MGKHIEASDVNLQILKWLSQTEKYIRYEYHQCMFKYTIQDKWKVTSLHLMPYKEGVA